MTLNEILKQANRSTEQITKIYYGKDHYCRCGCGGKYYEPSDNHFKRALNKMNKPDFYCFNVEIDNTYINIPVDNNGFGKCYCIYFD